MLIKEISIANFRGIREGKLSDLVQVNILVGPNNSGKSSVLETLALIAQAARAAVEREFLDPLGRLMPYYLLQRRVPRWRAEDLKEPNRDVRGSLVELHFAFDEANRIEVGALFEEGRKFLLKDCRVADLYNYTIEGGTPEDRQQLSRSVLVDAALAHDFETVERIAWSRIKADRSKERELRDVVAQAYKIEIESFSFIPSPGLDSRYGRYKLAIETPQRSIPVDGVGDGLRQALGLLSIAILARDSALMAEEPETHQHPEALSKMLRALFMMAKRNAIQLFISTHSLELINYALEAAEKEGLELKVYHLGLSQDGLLTARGIPAPDAKVLADIGADPRMLYKYASP